MEAELDALQGGVIDLAIDQYDVLSEPDSQYLFVDVRPKSNSRPAVGEFSFRFDGNDHVPEIPDGMVGSYPDHSGTRYSEREGFEPGWLLFVLPETGDASEAALDWPGGEWRPGAQLRTRLSEPIPSLTLREWDVPETVALDSAFSTEVTVRNDGDLTGRFFGGIEPREGPRVVATVSEPVPPDETRSIEMSGEKIVSSMVPEETGNDNPSITYQLDWLGGSISETVEIEGV